MKIFNEFVFSAFAVVVLSGCVALKPGNYSTPEEFCIFRTAEPIRVDGEDREAVWKIAPAYPFILADNKLRGYSNVPVNGGKIRMAYDDNYLYVLADLVDDDLRGYGENDTHLYARGDLVEVFVRNEKTGHYWEIYGAVNSKTSVLFYRNRGCQIFPEAILKEQGVTVFSKLDGTLNDDSDRDGGYRVEMSIPMTVFSSQGDHFGPGENWRVFCGRYDYNAFHEIMELSATSRQKEANYHDLTVFVPAVFVR